MSVKTTVWSTDCFSWVKDLLTFEISCLTTYKKYRNVLRIFMLLSRENRINRGKMT